MKTTLKEILNHNPCGQRAGSNTGWDLLTKTLGTKDLNTEVDLMTILKSNGIEDAIWVLRTQNYLNYCLFLADVAELALPVFEAYSPDDSRVRNCIQAVRDYKDGKIKSDRLKAAAESAMSAKADVWAAGAANAANAAAEAAGNTGSAIWAAVAAAGAAWAARSADATWTATWSEIEELFVKHFGSVV